MVVGNFHHTLLHPLKQTTKPTSDRLEANEDNFLNSEPMPRNSEVTTTCSLLGLNRSSDKTQNSKYLGVIPFIAKYKNKLVQICGFLV